MPTQASGLALHAIREYAERVGDAYSIYEESGKADLDGLVRLLGGRVLVAEGPESLVVREPGSFDVHVPTNTSLRRDRFTVAHELGHYFLHYLFRKRTGPEVFGRGLSNRAETEANTFASSLLMPAERFEAAHAELGGDAYRLAGRFDVSVRAAEVRCSVLGLT